MIPGVGCAGSSDCLIREVETLLPACRIPLQTEKTEKEAYNVLEMNNSWFNFEILHSCLPLCVLFFRLAARREAMP